jgi:excisionase family DNA binding protein
MRRLIPRAVSIHIPAQTIETPEARCLNIDFCRVEEATMNKTAYRISDLPIGKTKAYEEIRAGRLRAVKCGKLTLILPEDFNRWLKSLPAFVAISSHSPGTAICNSFEQNRRFHGRVKYAPSGMGE